MGITTFTSYQNNDRSFAIAPTSFGGVAQEHFTYIGFADSLDGDGFTTSYDDSKLFFAIKVSVTELTPVVSDFSGLWMPFEKHRDDKYATYSNGRTVEPTGNIGAWTSYNFGHVSGSPVAYHYKGSYNRIYFVLYDTTADSANTNRTSNTTGSYVMYYDIDKGVFSAPIALPQDYPASTDYHDLPGIIVSDNGYIIIAKEELAGGGASHNSEMEIWRSNAAETIEDPASPGSHYFTKVAQLTSGAYGLYSYPKFRKVTSTAGEITMFMRANGGSGQARFVCIRTQDNGSTWANLSGTSNVVTEIANGIDMGGHTGAWFMYNYPAKGPEKDGIHVFLFSVEPQSPHNPGPDGQPANSRGKYFFYLHSDDGVTWENATNHFAGGGFSKNVVSSSSITPAELLSNCLITGKDASSDANETISYYDSAVSSDGVPYLLNTRYYSYHSSATPDYSLKANRGISNDFTYYNTTTDAWVDVEISSFWADSKTNPYSAAGEVSLFSARPAVVAYNDGVVDVVIRRLKDQDWPGNIQLRQDFYPEYVGITSLSDLVTRQIYRIIATEPNNFYEGCAVGDYYLHGGTPTLDENNRLMPVEVETCFWRTSDNGTTWFQVREPLSSSLGNLALVNPPIAYSANMNNSGYLALFDGRARKTSPTAVAFDNSAFTMFIDKVQI